jgi:hypothetical protein
MFRPHMGQHQVIFLFAFGEITALFTCLPCSHAHRRLVLSHDWNAVVALFCGCRNFCASYFSCVSLVRSSCGQVNSEVVSQKQKEKSSDDGPCAAETCHKLENICKTTDILEILIITFNV